MIVATVMALSLSGVAQAQFEDMFIEQTGTQEQQPGSFAKSGWAGSINTGSSGVSYTSDYNAVKSSIHTPQQASAYMQENFTYGWDTRVSGFKATDPATVNATKWGDCKSMATFVSDVLSDDGIPVDLVVMKYGADRTDGNINAHVVTVATYQGAAWMTSNQDIWQVGSNQDIINISSANLPGGNARNLTYYPGTFRGELKPN